MEPSYYRFRFRRLIRRTKRLAKRGLPLAVEYFRLHVGRRWRQWQHIRRFALSWLVLVILMFIGLWYQTADLKEHYLAEGPREGGIFTEGMVGDVPTLNPIYPENNVSIAFNQLVFNGLMRYDGNGRLRGDIARQWEVSEDGTVYTVKLRDDVHWHDGQKLTAKDVVFTFTTIQDPDALSPLRANWNDIQISAPDEETVVFRLPNPFTPFLHSLTTGIIPQHILGNLPASQIRISEYNQEPVGTGPFTFDELVGTRNELQMIANEQYFRGAPKLDAFALRVVETPEELMDLYRNGQATGAADIDISRAEEIEKLEGSELLNIPLSSNVYAFFSNDHRLLKDKALRQALVMAARPARVVRALHLRVNPADSALLPEQPGYRGDLVQLDFNRKKAQQVLEKAGWKLGEDSVRYKNGKPLELELVTQKNETLPAAATVLQEDWAATGVRLKVKLVSLQELQQDHIRPRNYEILMTGVKIGADPDVYAYWHSSQVRDPGLNLSQYKSDEADLALEAGRTRPNGKVRNAKYHTFLKEWRSDAPAAALYRTQLLYALRERIVGPKLNRLIDAGHRFHNIQDWTVRTESTLKRRLPQSE